MHFVVVELLQFKYFVNLAVKSLSSPMFTVVLVICKATKCPKFMFEKLERVLKSPGIFFLQNYGSHDDDVAEHDDNDVLLFGIYLLRIFVTDAVIVIDDE